MGLVKCITCGSDEQAKLEAIGSEALAGDISWREAGRRAGMAHMPLKNHMEKHYVDAVVAEADELLDGLIATAIRELAENMAIAPAEVKPLYAAAIVNLRGLKDTKPSQQHLIQSLKTIQEMTGMKQEQRLMLTFAEHMGFGASIPVKAIDAISDAVLVGEVIEDDVAPDSPDSALAAGYAAGA